MRNINVGRPSYARVAGSVPATRPAAGPVVIKWAEVVARGPSMVQKSAVAWRALDSTTKLATLMDWVSQNAANLDRRPSVQEITEAVTAFDAWAANPALTPSLSSLGLSCEQWAVLSNSDRGRRIVDPLLALGMLPDNEDIAAAINAVQAECDAQSAGRDAETRSVFRLTLRAPAGTMPQDVIALVDGRAMELVSQTRGVALSTGSGSRHLPTRMTANTSKVLPDTRLRILPGGTVRQQVRAAGQAGTPDIAIFEIRGVAGARKVTVAGTGISLRQQDVNLASGATTSMQIDVTGATAPQVTGEPGVAPTPEPTPTEPTEQSDEHVTQEAAPPGMYELCPTTPPTFMTESARNAWIASHQGCPAPPPATGLSTAAKVGIGVAALAAVGGITYAIIQARKSK